VHISLPATAYSGVAAAYSQHGGLLIYQPVSNFMTWTSAAPMAASA